MDSVHYSSYLKRRLAIFLRREERVLTNVETPSRVAALTFDDGPHPVYTPQVLRILKKHGAKATFFMVGESASQYPEIVKDVAEAGHVIGNHSWNHPYLPNIPSRLDRLKQLWNCARATAPYCQRLFRPPFGAQNSQVRFDARLFAYKVILWNVSAQDWTLQDSEEVAQKMINRVKPGSIFLLHDAIYPYAGNEVSEEISDRVPMLQGLDMALSVLKQQIQFVTVPELLLAGKPVCHWPIP